MECAQTSECMVGNTGEGPLKLLYNIQQYVSVNFSLNSVSTISAVFGFKKKIKFANYLIRLRQNLFFNEIL
jgi:hypothetical protein